MIDQLDDPFKAWLALEKNNTKDEITKCHACDQRITYAGICIEKRIYCYNCAQEIREEKKMIREMK